MNFAQFHKNKNSFFYRGLLIRNHEYLVIRNISKKKKKKNYMQLVILSTIRSYRS